MELVYLFYDSGCIRIPFFDYDPGLFGSFVKQGGIWDKAGREFVYHHNDNAGQFKLNLQGRPCVKVNKDSPSPVSVYGFWERPWEESAETCTAACNNPAQSIVADQIQNQNRISEESPAAAANKFFMLGPAPAPEILSEYWLSKFDAELRSRKYSKRTIRLYIYFVRLLCRTLQKIPEEISSEDVTRFLADVEKNREYSASSLNLAISAIKFFFTVVMKNKCIDERYRPRNSGKLPSILSKDEISKILSMEKNPKHRLLIMLVYSSGLRVSEVVALKKEHIDVERKVIYVREGKGRKDRYTLLSEKAAQFITEYCAFFGIQTWLFPGQPPTRPLSIRSAQHIFNKAVRHAGIHKEISIHGLRHTFATHLLESGTDIRYIQTLLGHASIRTTERYTHVAKRNVLNIKSPLDTLS